MNNIIILWELYLKAENRADYINRGITEPTKISNNKKKLTQEAILWLLTKGPHTVEEISDHFEISPELVKCLIKELNAANLVVEEYGYFRYHLNSEQRIKIKFPAELNLQRARGI